MTVLERLKKLYQHTCNNCTQFQQNTTGNNEDNQCSHKKGRRLYYWHPDNENNCTYYQRK